MMTRWIAVTTLLILLVGVASMGAGLPAPDRGPSEISEISEAGRDTYFRI